MCGTDSFTSLPPLVTPPARRRKRRLQETQQLNTVALTLNAVALPLPSRARSTPFAPSRPIPATVRPPVAPEPHQAGYLSSTTEDTRHPWNAVRPRLSSQRRVDLRRANTPLPQPPDHRSRQRRTKFGRARSTTRKPDTHRTQWHRGCRLKRRVDLRRAVFVDAAAARPRVAPPPPSWPPQVDHQITRHNLQVHPYWSRADRPDPWPFQAALPTMA
jgi:hypothetical protein